MDSGRSHTPRLTCRNPLLSLFLHIYFLSIVKRGPHISRAFSLESTNYQHFHPTTPNSLLIPFLSIQNTLGEDLCNIEKWRREKHKEENYYRPLLSCPFLSFNWRCLRLVGIWRTKLGRNMFDFFHHRRCHCFVYRSRCWSGERKAWRLIRHLLLVGCF